MEMTRREFVLLSMALMAAGCTDSTATTAARPGPTWPAAGDRPRPAGSVAGGGNYPAYPRANQPSAAAASPPPAVAQPPALSATPPPPVQSGGLHVIPRSAWTNAAPRVDRMYAMDGVNRITVHHEGWKVVSYTDYVTTQRRMDEMRLDHIDRFHSGDIGYHYVIDRAGRLWQGRDVRYQGAHVKSENEHNVGVMVLGNFEEQSPTEAQIATLRESLTKLMKYFRVPVSRVYTHQELGQTLCPGRNLQPRVAALRRGGYLA